MGNQRLEELMDEMKRGNKEESLSRELNEILREASVFVPAVMPKNTDPEILRQMLQTVGDKQSVPKGANPTPCILENAEKKKFLAVFTSEEELRKSPEKAPKFPLTLNMKFTSCVDFLKRNPSVVGAVINPYSHNFIFKLGKKKEEKELSVSRFHALTRGKLESSYLPGLLFAGKEKRSEVIDRIVKDRGAYIKELYDELYDTDIANPYTEDDFECMTLNITDNLLLIQLSLPQKYAVEKTCPSIIIGYNRQSDTVWYFAVVRGKTKKENRLHRLCEGGADLDLGEAPAEGNELNTVLDFIREEDGE